MPTTLSESQVKSGSYGGIARRISDTEILSTIRNGTRKKSSSHRYGTAVTSVRPENPCARTQLTG